ALSIMVGGDAGALERARPVLETFGDRIRHVGDVGAGQAVKLLNNALFVANVVMANEAVRLGPQFGLDPSIVQDVLQTSSGGSVGLQALPALAGSEWGRHALAVLRKDVD